MTYAERVTELAAEAVVADEAARLEWDRHVTDALEVAR